ncbi:MAG: ABC transporter ATP-binding protein [Desulfobulbaceae bacterium]|nr:ABC transporter ATP-binding protein [Desulfobulbaceae bacterium]
MDGKLLIEDIGKRYGDTWVLRNVRAIVPNGQITAFIGPNGAGKTTLFHIIAGALKPEEGRVEYFGRDITGLSPHMVARLGLGRQFQDVRVFKSLSVLDNVLVGMIPEHHHMAWSAWCRPFHTDRSIRALREQARYWLDYVGLDDVREQPAGELSFGQQKLLSLARLFARQSECLLLDEPTAGVSQVMVERIVGLIRRRVGEGSLTVAAFIEHNMSAVQQLADWIHFLHEGRVAFSGKSEHVLGHRTVRELYMGI